MTPSELALMIEKGEKWLLQEKPMSDKPSNTPTKAEDSFALIGNVEYVRKDICQRELTESAATIKALREEVAKSRREQAIAEVEFETIKQDLALTPAGKDFQLMVLEQTNSAHIVVITDLEEESSQLRAQVKALKNPNRCPNCHLAYTDIESSNG